MVEGVRALIVSGGHLLWAAPKQLPIIWPRGITYALDSIAHVMIVSSIQYSSSTRSMYLFMYFNCNRVLSRVHHKKSTGILFRDVCTGAD
jgi:multisubunit Na+/H+ antiporter MnhC subunit